MRAEYRTPDLNVRNGCLKALAFLFEYVGEMAKDYVYAVTTMIEDALTDRDAVHRQTAAAIVKHIALDVVGLNREDAMMHMMNLVWPNVLELSPHVVNVRRTVLERVLTCAQNVFEAIEAMSLALGPGVVLSYTWAGLAHPARRMREACACDTGAEYADAGRLACVRSHRSDLLLILQVQPNVLATRRRSYALLPPVRQRLAEHFRAGNSRHLGVTATDRRRRRRSPFRATLPTLDPSELGGDAAIDINRHPDLYQNFVDSHSPALVLASAVCLSRASPSERCVDAAWTRRTRRELELSHCRAIHRGRSRP